MTSTRKAPLVALVGRPNVGKSTLFNRLVGRRQALVHDQPGVTRDRLFADATIGDRLVRLVDTGGLDVGPQDVVMGGMREQTQLAIDEADLVLLVVDAAAGLTAADREAAALLRRAGAATVVVANKVDVPAHDAMAGEFYELGIEPVLSVSAEHARGIAELKALLCERLDLPTVEAVDAERAPLPVREDDAPVAGGERVAHGVEPGGDAYNTRCEWPGGALRVAVIGRPNAGKSSLVNRLLGEERLLATPVAGTTRDPIDTELTIDGQRFVFIDTAGVRRKRSIADRLEHFAVVKAFQSIDRADVVVVVLDATEAPSDQDARIVAMAADKGKGLVLAVNKWDLVENPEWRERYPEALRQKLRFVEFAALLRLSAKTGRGVSKLFPAVLAAQRERHRRVSTSELNRFFHAVVAQSPPPAQGGRRPKLLYVSQPLVRPPTFIFSTRHPGLVRDPYRRYLENALRDRYGFGGTPIWLKFRDSAGPAVVGSR